MFEAEEVPVLLHLDQRRIPVTKVLCETIDRRALQTETAYLAHTSAARPCFATRKCVRRDEAIPRLLCTSS